MKVGQEVYIHQWDSTTGDVWTDVSNTNMDGLERAVITHVGGFNRNGQGPLCWVEWVDRPVEHTIRGSFRPSTQLFLEEL